MKKKIVFFYIIMPLVILGGGLEIYARLKSQNITAEDAYRILDLEKAPFKDRLTRDRQLIGQPKFHNYHLYSMRPIKTGTITITDYFCARRTPDSAPLGRGKAIVWMFGGSTMQNVDTTDEWTLANQAARVLAENGCPVTLFNFGVGSFQSTLESIKFQHLLRKVNPEHHPDIAVFLDGVNEGAMALMSGAGGMQYDVHLKLKAMVERRSPVVWAYSLSNIISEVSEYWRRFVAPQIAMGLFPRPEMDIGPVNLQKTVDIYVANTRMIRAVCREFGVTPVFLLQPAIHTKKNLTDFEKEVIAKIDPKYLAFMARLYEMIPEAMAGRDDFYNISGVFDESRQNDFYDYTHNGPYSGQILGRAIADILLNLLHNQG